MYEDRTKLSYMNDTPIHLQVASFATSFIATCSCSSYKHN